MEEIEVGTSQSNNKRPTFLTVLIVLTWIWAAMAIMTSFTAFMSGPLNEEKLADQDLAAATSIKEMKDQGQDQFTYLIEIGQDRMHYVHEEAFVKNYAIILLISILGAVSGYMMWNRRKIGFHLYILYSLLYIVMPYLIYPMNMVINLEIYFNLAIGGLFVLLYSRNLYVME